MRRDKRSKEKKRKKRNLKIIMILILFIIIGLGSYLGYSIHKNGGGLQGLLATVLGQDAEKLENLEPINILLLGISEDLDSKLTDTIMVCSYNPKTQRASMLSIPRDTFIGKNQKKADGFDKINSVYSKKGPEQATELVEDITGMNIKYYVVVNNQVVIDLINTIGGVYFDVPIDMDYDDKTQNLHIHLEAGYQKLDGDHAEQLLRFRHNNNGTSYPSEYGDNDYGRMKTQREFMMEVAKQTLKLKNVTKIKTIMTTIFQNVETNLTLDDVFPYVPWAVSFDTANISSNQIAGESKQYNKLWFFAYDEEETSKIVTNMVNYIKGIETSTEGVSNTTNITNKANTVNATNTSSKKTNTTKTNTTKSNSKTKNTKSTKK